MKKIILTVLSVLGFITVQAYRIDWGRNVVISKPVYEDLYIAAGTVTINAPVYGDLIVAGGSVYINDSIMNDLLLTGGTVRINAYIADDIRCAGGDIALLKNIGGDLVITGGKVFIANGVIITGGLASSGGEITLDGTVNGSVRSVAASFIFNGQVNKDFNCRADKLIVNGVINGSSVIATRKLSIGTNASFGNSIRYWVKDQKTEFGKYLRSGYAVYDPRLKLKSRSWYFLGHATVIGMIWYMLMVFLFIALIQYLFSATFRKAGDNFDHSLPRSILFGFLFFLAVPIGALILFVTIIGIPIGLILMLSYVSLILLATIITSIVVANWYNYKFDQGWSYWNIVWSALAMFILFKLVSFTPFLGSLIMIVIACMAFGAILRNINWRRRRKIALT
jgi:cytoskeletal protein CcmA (bactofilin family)